MLLIRETVYALGIMVLVAGCATKPPTLGRDGIYRLDYTSKWCAAASEDYVREEARGKAIEFCASQNKDAKVISARGQSGILGIQCAVAWIEYKCEDRVKQ
jgi:hypothetical protein